MAYIFQVSNRVTLGFKTQKQLEELLDSLNYAQKYLDKGLRYSGVLVSGPNVETVYEYLPRN